MPRTDSALPGVVIQDNNSSGLITLAQCQGDPASVATTANKYAVGCIITNAQTGKAYQNEGTSASPSWNEIGNIGTADISDGAVTDAKFATANVGVVPRTATATANGLTTGTLTAGSQHTSVTSANATDIITLPAPVVGTQIVLDVGANGFKLQSSTPASIAINGGTGASAKSTIAANSTLFLICVSLTSWKGYFLDADSDVAKIPAAA